MPATDDIGKYANAILAQLNAEVAAANLDTKTFARTLNIDYNTFRRYLKGEREMPMRVFWLALDALSIDHKEFIGRAQERFRYQS